jgi:hypothetical protein
MMTNRADWWGRSHSLDKSAHPCWIVHEAANLMGVGGALVLGDKDWVVGQWCLCSTKCWAGAGLSRVGVINILLD